MHAGEDSHILDASLEYCAWVVRMPCRIPGAAGFKLACAFLTVRRAVSTQGKNRIEKRKSQEIVGSKMASASGGSMRGIGSKNRSIIQSPFRISLSLYNPDFKPFQFDALQFQLAPSRLHTPPPSHQLNFPVRSALRLCDFAIFLLPLWVKEIAYWHCRRSKFCSLAGREFYRVLDLFVLLLWFDL